MIRPLFESFCHCYPGASVCLIEYQQQQQQKRGLATVPNGTLP